MSSSGEYTTQEQVMFFDTDIGGVVHNLAYLRMIETCRTFLAENIGFDLSMMTKEKIFPVIVRTEADYKKPATLGDKLLIKGRIEEYSKTSFWCAFTVVSAQDPEKVFVTCRQRLAIVQMPEGRPIRVPQSILKQLELSLED